MLLSSPARAARVPAGTHTALAAFLVLSALPGSQDPRAPTGARHEPGTLTLATAEDLTGEGLAFVELDAGRDTFLVGEPFRLRVRFGVAREELRPRLVQLFQRPLDLPVQVLGTGPEAHQGLRDLAADEVQDGVSVAQGERIVRARSLGETERAGRVYDAFELARTVAATREGTLTLAAPALGFAHASRFEEDFVRGRVPVDRREARVRGVGITLSIRAPPEEGRPPEFTGAIGRFRFTARAEPQDVVLGQGLALSLRLEAVEPSAPLAAELLPPFEAPPGLRVHGRLVEQDERGVTARFDLVPEAAGVFELPPVRFAYFDTTPPAGYRTLASDPIPLVVRAPASGAAPPATFAHEARQREGKAPRAAVLELALALTLAVALFLLVRARRRRRISRD